MEERPPANPYRVKHDAEYDGPPLTEPQQQALVALLELCPESGHDATSAAVARHAGIRLGAVVVILRSLAHRRLALWFGPEESKADEAWAPTMTGRSRGRHIMELRARMAEAD